MVLVAWPAKGVAWGAWEASEGAWVKGWAWEEEWGWGREWEVGEVAKWDLDPPAIKASLAVTPPMSRRCSKPRGVASKGWGAKEWEPKEGVASRETVAATAAGRETKAKTIKEAKSRFVRQFACEFRWRSITPRQQKWEVQPPLPHLFTTGS